MPIDVQYPFQDKYSATGRIALLKYLRFGIVQPVLPNSYLADIEEQAQERFNRIIEQMKQAQRITKQLKAENTWEWVGRMNNIQVCAREMVDRETFTSKKK